MRPNKDALEEYYHQYIDLVKGDDLAAEMGNSQRITQELLGSINPDKETYRYADGKWSIREIIGHLIDSERVFNYRALRFARDDNTELHGFEHNDYATASKANDRSLTDLAAEYTQVRGATMSLFSTFDEEMLEKGGVANGSKATVLGLGFVIVGHEIHHTNVIKERYLNDGGD